MVRVQHKGILIAYFFVTFVVDRGLRETKNTPFSSVDSGSTTLAYYPEWARWAYPLSKGIFS